MNQEALEEHLWGAATWLRAHIDAGDYKQFIFPAPLLQAHLRRL